MRGTCSAFRIEPSGRQQQGDNRSEHKDGHSCRNQVNYPTPKGYLKLRAFPAGVAAESAKRPPHPPAIRLPLKPPAPAVWAHVLVSGHSNPHSAPIAKNAPRCRAPPGANRQSDWGEVFYGEMLGWPCIRKHHRSGILVWVNYGASPARQKSTELVGSHSHASIVKKGIPKKEKGASCLAPFSSHHISRGEIGVRRNKFANLASKV